MDISSNSSPKNSPTEYDQFLSYCNSPDRSCYTLRVDKAPDTDLSTFRDDMSRVIDFLSPDVYVILYEDGTEKTGKKSKIHYQGIIISNEHKYTRYFKEHLFQKFMEKHFPNRYSGSNRSLAPVRDIETYLPYIFKGDKVAFFTIPPYITMHGLLASSPEWSKPSDYDDKKLSSLILAISPSLHQREQFLKIVLIYRARLRPFCYRQVEGWVNLLRCQEDPDSLAEEFYQKYKFQSSPY